MLAEPRKKTKWTLNPRGKTWTEDPNKYGQKLLERMGWSRGEGLGARGQGITSHIEVKLKSDRRGLGFDHKDTDWCKHQGQFEDILSELSNSMEPMGVEGATQSLEERSKASKVRLHYHKATQGKDVSKYSKNDLDCILGLRSVPEIVEPPEETPVIQDVGMVDNSFGVTTIVGGSIQDYLNKKMLSKDCNGVEGGQLDDTHGKRRKKKRKRGDESESSHYGEGQIEPLGGIEVDNLENVGIPKVKKTKKKGKSLPDPAEGSSPRKQLRENTASAISVEDMSVKWEDAKNQLKSDSSKKKRKCSRSKMEEKSSGTMDEMVSGDKCPSTNNADEGAIGLGEKIKRKKKIKAGSVSTNSTEDDRESKTLGLDDIGEVQITMKKVRKSSCDKRTKELKASCFRDMDANCVENVEVERERVDVPKKKVFDANSLSSEVYEPEFLNEKHTEKRKKKKSKRDKGIETVCSGGMDTSELNGSRNGDLISKIVNNNNMGEGQYTLKEVRKSSCDKSTKEMNASCFRDMDANCVENVEVERERLGIPKKKVFDANSLSSEVHEPEFLNEKHTEKRKKKKSKRDKGIETVCSGGIDNGTHNGDLIPENSNGEHRKLKKAKKSKCREKAEGGEMLFTSTVDVIDTKDAATVKVQPSADGEEKVVRSKKKKRAQDDSGDILSAANPGSDSTIGNLLTSAEVNGKKEKTKKKRKEEKEVTVERSQQCAKSVHDEEIKLYKCMKGKCISKEELERSCRMFPGANLFNISGYGK